MRVSSSRRRPSARPCSPAIPCSHGHIYSPVCCTWRVRTSSRLVNRCARHSISIPRWSRPICIWSRSRAMPIRLARLKRPVPYCVDSCASRLDRDPPAISWWPARLPQPFGAHSPRLGNRSSVRACFGSAMASHLIFELNKVRYALAAATVRGTFWLPELSPAEDLPEYVVGLVNWQGRVVPILDLALRFGHAFKPYRLSQAVILIEEGRQCAGLVVDVVHDLVEIDPQAIAPYVQREEAAPSDSLPMIAGSVKWHDGVLILLDPSVCIRLDQLAGQEDRLIPDPIDRFGELDPAARARLRERTHRLAQTPVQASLDRRLFARVRIGASRIALPLDTIAEVAHLHAYTPIPCCPSHVLGAVNQRGAILILYDMAPLLQGRGHDDYSSIVVLRAGALRLGLAVHQIEDIRDHDPSAVAPVSGSFDGHGYFSALLQDTDGVAGVLDIRVLLRQGVLEVDAQD
ncbi:MAG: chemotaxis protein CheW [Gammaproteobacteria bacterium]|nr:chemotaxis protein CheW [Gammaproteobacteria bacterium]